MNPAASIQTVGSDFWRRAAAAKGRRRRELAAMAPEAVQAAVSGLPPDGGAWTDVTPAGRWQLGFPESDDPPEDAPSTP